MKRTFQSLIVGGFAALALFVMVPAADAAYRTVQPGDTLSRVYGSRWAEVCRINRLANCNLIHVGQRLDDGLGGATTAVAGVSTSRTVQTSVPTYLAVGKPYVYGAAGPYAFDCSGLTQYLSRAMGRSIPRTSYQQMYAGRGISRGELRPGDLIIMNGGGHVGMYIGGNQMIQALNPSQGIIVSSIEYGTAYNPVHSFRAIGH